MKEKEGEKKKEKKKDPTQVHLNKGPSRAFISYHSPNVQTHIKTKRIEKRSKKECLDRA